MIKLIKSWFKSNTPKSIAFIDGDQPLGGVLNAYDTYLKGTETHFIRLRDEDSGEPKLLRGRTGFNKIYLSGYTAKKEVTDKFIGAYIQKAVGDGYQNITVVSSDYDFIDIFKMAVVLNPEAKDVSFRIIVPKAKGRMLDTPEQMMNIEIVKM